MYLVCWFVSLLESNQLTNYPANQLFQLNLLNPLTNIFISYLTGILREISA